MRRSLKRFLVSNHSVVAPLIKRLFFGQRHILTCLNYHRVIADSEALKEASAGRGISVSASCFEKQMKYLRDNVRCLNLPDFIAALRAEELKEDCVHVTFDDGYHDNIEHALPILERYQIPASIFVTVGFVDGSVRPWWYELECLLREGAKLDLTCGTFDISTAVLKEKCFEVLTDHCKQLTPEGQAQLLEQIRLQVKANGNCSPRFLSWQEIEALDKNPLVTIGAHSMSHAVLSKLSVQELESELAGARQVLEQKLSHAIPFTAYPYGQKDQVSVREFSMTRSLGYEAAFTMRFGHITRAHRSYPVALPRIPVVMSDDLTDFQWKLSGLEAIRRNGLRQVIFD